MKNKIKILFTLLAILFMTGCSVEYNLYINEDSSINEEIIAKEKTDRIEQRTKLKGDQATNYLFNMFKRKNEDISFNTQVENMNTYGIAKTTHNNIDEYSNRFNSDVFEKVEVTNSDNVITIIAQQSESLLKGAGTSLLYDDITVNVTIPFIVEDHNADKVVKNKYTWKIKSTDELKNIKISYRDKEFNDRTNIKINNKNYSIKFEYIIIGILVSILALIIIIILRNSKKNNVV